MFSVPEDVCLLGCIFYIADYQKYLEYSTLDMWRQVVNTHFTSGSFAFLSFSALCVYVMARLSVRMSVYPHYGSIWYFLLFVCNYICCSLSSMEAIYDLLKCVIASNLE